ncbi:MAG: DeoR family transcriptional regulator [Methanosarcinales archaeon]|nr:DeoR family transcriptional regulator [Methanosarcinales archaeon]
MCCRVDACVSGSMGCAAMAVMWVSSRQQWFLNQLNAGENIKNTDLASHRNVSEKTAKRDIAYLIKQGIIEFIGPTKTGAYYLKEQRDVI